MSIRQLSCGRARCRSDCRPARCARPTARTIAADATARATASDATARVSATDEVQPRRRVTPLHRAAKAGTLEEVRAARAASSSIDTIGPAGDTALHVAASRWPASRDVVSLLLDGRASPSSRDDYGDLPLHAAAWRGAIDV
eukprot:4893743-Prymnesium_polylepis.1